MQKFFKKLNRRRTTKQQGSTIVELLIATVVVGSVITGIAVALTYNIHQNAEVRYREAAASMNQQALEAFRRERERLSWDAFYAGLNNATYCINSLGNSLENLTQSPSTCGTNTYEFAKTDFKREVIVGKIDADTIEFAITTFWHANTADEISATTRHTMKNRPN